MEPSKTSKYVDDGVNLRVNCRLLAFLFFYFFKKFCIE